jgi:hypothetical protein
MAGVAITGSGATSKLWRSPALGAVMLVASSSSLTASHAAVPEGCHRPLVQAAIGLRLERIDAHVAEEGVVDRAAGVGDVEVIDVDGQRAGLAGNRAEECGEQLATALNGVLRVIWMARTPLMRTDSTPLLVPCVTCNSM